MIAILSQPAVLSVIFGLLLALSEALALNPKIKANSIFQLIHGLLKKKAAEEKADAEAAPEAEAPIEKKV